MTKLSIAFQPGYEWRFEELPPRSIALDGACQGTQLDPLRQRYSFDHHAGCVRLATTAACQQVFDAILLGFDPQNHAVLINHVDADTVLATWLLQHSGRWRIPAEREKVRPLVAAVAARDAHGPAYPAPAMEYADYYYANVMVPSHRLKGKKAAQGELENSLHQCLAIIENWWKDGLPINSVPARQLKMPPMDTHGTYVLVGAGELPPEDQGLLVSKLYEAGHDRILLWSQDPSGRFRYGLAKRSDLVTGFPLEEIYRALNEAESQARGSVLVSGQTWGGASTVGGSPRDKSVLPPCEVMNTIDHVLSVATAYPANSSSL